MSLMENARPGERDHDAVLGRIEFCAWAALLMTPIIWWLQGPSVSTDQFVVRTALVAIPAAVGVGLRIRAWSPRIKRVSRIGLALIIWIAANCAAIAWFDIYESEVLEAEFHVPASVIRSYESRTRVLSLQGARPVSLWYRFLPPSRSGTRAVPLVVYLHGAGGRGSDNVRQLDSVPSVLCERSMRDLYPCAVLAPQCPEPWSWSQWLDADTDLIDGVLRMIDDVLTDSRIDPSRIYLVGISMGGFGTWEMAMRAPERFAAVLPFCGGGDESRVARLVDTPLWAIHGADDTVVPAEQTRIMIEALRAAGGSPRYLEMPGVGHDCWDPHFRPGSEVLAWMFQQARPPPSGSARPQ
jgi:pimeloyl-ACP methyl ester carboxylesterase